MIERFFNITYNTRQYYITISKSIYLEDVYSEHSKHIILAETY